MKVRNFYRPRAGYVSPNDTVREAARQMRAGGWSCLPVLIDDSVVALITERDLVEAAANGARPAVARVSDYMNDGSTTVSLEDDISTATLKMLAIECRHLPVVDSGRLVGMVSARDVFLLAAQTESRGAPV
jgi:CBS domain-containing protein